MNNKGLKYNVDIVFCINMSQYMYPMLKILKANIMSFYPDLLTEFKEKGKNVDSLRIRIIAFRDFDMNGNEALEQLDFVTLPKDEEKLKSFINSLTIKKSGDESTNGLEALALAIKSDWDKGGDKQRHIIVVWSDGSTHPLEKPSSCRPSGMPTNFNELTDWWDGQTSLMPSVAAKRLILFTPDITAWTDISTYWYNTIHYPLKAGEGLSEIGYKTILGSIVGGAFW